MDEEIDRFKREIDLRAYAAAQGYQLDRKKSWRGAAVMQNGNDKIVINRGTDGHYVYFSVRDDRDNGTIIDFVKNRLGLTLGAVRQELRRFLPAGGASAPSIAPALPGPLPVFTPLEATSKDRLKVEATYRRMRDLAWHDYLESERGLPRDLLTAERFAGRIQVDARGNAVFPHFDENGLCGYEIRNREFKGFATGGTKGLWESNDFDEDDRLVFSESAIDALSFAVLHPDGHTRYRSVGGKLNPVQPDLVRAAIVAMPAGSVIIAAMDNDEDGRKLSRLIEQSVPAGLSFVDAVPTLKDWNDVLKSGSPSFFSFLPPGSGHGA